MTNDKSGKGNGGMNDFRFAFRQLLKNPGFTAVAVLTLALGIGAGTIVFSVAKAVLFHPLGIDSPERVMWLGLTDTRTGKAGSEFSWIDFTDLRAQSGSFAQLALISWPAVTWEHGDQVEDLTSLHVTADILDVLRIRPFLGRGFEASDTDPAGAPVALLSHEFWQARFGGDPHILGQTLRLNEKARTVIGILPPHLEFPLGHAPAVASGATVYAGVHDVWLPLRVDGEDATRRGNRMHRLIGRLKPERTLAAARVELSTLGKRWATEYPDTNRGLALEAVGYQEKALGPTRKGIQVLALAVGAVLAICCVNLANLLLARGVARQRELAVRMALGARRARLLTILLTESVLLSLAGGFQGVGLAEAALRLIRAYGPAEVPFLHEVVLDGTVLGLTFGLSLATAFVFGLAPALWQSRIAASEVLKSGTRSSVGPHIRAWQQGLLVGQVAMVLVLLASAGLLIESFRRLMGVDLGYQPREVIALDLENRRVPTNEDTVRLYKEIHRRIVTLPGVEAAGTIQSTPLTGKWTWEEKAQVFGQSLAPAEQPSLAVTFIAFDYFQALRIPLVDGRFFQNADLRDDGYGSMAILNQSAAARLFPGISALGRRFSISSSPGRFYEIVGVVKDTRDSHLEQPPQPRFYLHYTHGGSQLIIRIQEGIPAQAMIPRIRDALKEFAPRLVIEDIKPLSEIVSDTVAERRFLMAMLGVYAAVALGIAAVGIFGVVTYQVRQRTNEFGIRLALGASPMRLMRLVLMEAGRLGIAGLAIGLVFALATNRFLATQLFGVSPHDPWLLATVGGLLLVVGVLASLLPALHAARTDPLRALRHE